LTQTGGVKNVGDMLESYKFGCVSDPFLAGLGNGCKKKLDF